MQVAVTRAGLPLIRMCQFWFQLQNIFQLSLTYKIRPQLRLYLQLREGGEHQQTQLANTADTKTICHGVGLLWDLMSQLGDSPPSASLVHHWWALLMAYTHLQGFSQWSTASVVTCTITKTFQSA